MNKIKKYSLLAVVGLVLTLVLCGCGNKGFEIFDGSNSMVHVKGENKDHWTDLTDNEKNYIELVIEEAEGIISEVEDCDAKTARKKLFKGEYPKIYTYYDGDISKALSDSYEDYEAKALEVGCVVADTSGRVLAVMSRGGDENHVTAKTPPYSSFKPLAVYMQAVEKNIASWSKLYLDAPVKQIKESDNSFRDWPANATNTYRFANVTLNVAIRESLNTVAVKCMGEIGVKESLRYMKDKLGIDLPFESDKLRLEGEEEVYGNVALGYLQEGVSPLEMAGYYQLFANGGFYQKPGAVSKICDGDGNTVYTREDKRQSVISGETAFIMNKLLCEVVTSAGTGEKAYLSEIRVGGKTGTGDKGNWFVGFTPQYVCAVWHGKQVSKNISSEFFSRAVSKFDLDKTAEYPKCDGVKEYIYCAESGKLISPNCKKAAMGYCVQSEVLETCNGH